MVSTQTRPYRTEKWLREKYYVEGLTQEEMAEQAGVATRTIQKYMDRLGVDTGQSTNPDHDKYKDEERMRKLYVDKQLTTQEIADMLGVSQTTIRKWLDRHEIEKRPPRRPSKPHTESFYSEAARAGGKSYEKWCVSDCGDVHRIRVHRLLAVAEYGFDAVAGNHIHHISGVGWDNRPDNIVPVPPGLHPKVEKEGVEQFEEELKEMGVEV